MDFFSRPIEDIPNSMFKDFLAIIKLRTSEQICNLPFNWPVITGITGYNGVNLIFLTAGRMLFNLVGMENSMYSWFLQNARTLIN